MHYLKIEILFENEKISFKLQIKIKIRILILILKF